MTPSELLLTPADLRGCELASLRSLVGDKAAELCEFWGTAAAIGGRTPRFSLVGTGFLAGFYRQVWRPVPLWYPPLPTVEAVPGTVRALAESLAGYTDRRGVPIGEPAVLRSSMVWPTVRVPRTPGVDTTAFLCAAADRASVLAEVCAGLYKAYTSFCLRMAGANGAIGAAEEAGTRAAGLIIMELLAVRAQGTAYLRGDRIVVELAPVPGELVVLTSLPRLRRTACIAPRTAAVLAELLAALTPALADPRLLEIEFLIGRDDEPYLLQQRTLPGSADPGGADPGGADAGAGFPVFSSVGEFAGPAVDLRGLPRTGLAEAELARRLEQAAGSVVVVPLKDDAAVDAFAVAWLLRHRTDLPAPAALLVTHDGRTQAGIKTHLKWMLRDALPGTLVVAAPGRQIPRRSRGLTVRSDGVTARVVPISPRRAPP